MTFLNPAGCHYNLVRFVLDPLRMLSKKRGGLNNTHSMTSLNPVLASWLPLRMRNVKRGGTERKIFIIASRYSARSISGDRSADFQANLRHRGQRPRL